MDLFFFKFSLDLTFDSPLKKENYSMNESLHDNFEAKNRRKFQICALDCFHLGVFHERLNSLFTSYLSILDD